MNFSIIKSIIIKDIVIEYRSREAFNSVLFFSLLVIAIGSFAIEPGTKAVFEISSGLLWISYIFSSTLILNHSFIVEKEENIIQGLIISPYDKINIFLGKYAVNFIYIFCIEIIILIAFIILFNINITKSLIILLIYIIMIDIGLVSVGTLFASMLINSKAREMLLPILLFPIIIPLLIVSVKATTILLQDEPHKYAVPFLKLIISFDIVYLISSLILSEYSITD
jgi:heme exporter protein B